MKLKVKTLVKERYQKLLDFITIDVLNIGKKNSSQDINTLPTTPTINSYLKKYPMLWELINLRLVHPSESVMK